MATPQQSQRQQLADWFRASLAQLDFGARLPGVMRQSPRPLGDHQVLIAFGKAARSMAASVLREYPEHQFRGLIVPPEPDDKPLAPFEVIPGGHPLPSSGSVTAAARALELAASVTPDEELLFLVSGGGSAMLEQPLEPGVTLEQLRKLYQALVGCGGTIDEINTIRKHCSAIKGGKLAHAARAARFQRTLAISDVPCDRLETIASGPTVTDSTTPAECLELIEQLGVTDALPPGLLARLRDASTAAEADQGPSNRWMVAAMNNATATSALRELVEQAGLRVEIDEDSDDRPWDEAVALLLDKLRNLKALHPGERVAVIAGGELSVPLPTHPGIGGRNQHFALGCALQIAGEPITVMSCGTDGIDGNSPAAGAVADGTTLTRAQDLGLDAGQSLQRFDAFPLFDALGDSVVVGPSGTNVRDLRLLVHD